MKTVIAEKPSVAREIAGILGAHEKMDGYFTGKGYQVTWAPGYLIGLATPEDYGISGFDEVTLPILPDPFMLTVRKVKKDKVYGEVFDAVKQLKVIEQLFNTCDRIIVATDPGREGELIFRYIYEYFNCTKPFERLWISSLTEKAIKQGFENLKTGHEYQCLYQSARAQSQADWLIGINASQAFELVTGDVYSIGRVQIPVLTLICQRYLENKNFKVQKYWQIELSHYHQYIHFKSLSVNRWENKKEVEHILSVIKRSENPLSVLSAETKNLREPSPLLFNLTTLQKQANKQLNLTAEETLNIAQSLYEKKFITYPRTGSGCIPEDLWNEIPHLIKSLLGRDTCKEAAYKIIRDHFNKRIVNNLRVYDHHGLLITGKLPSALSARENAVYDMIAFRLLEALSDDCIREIREAKLQVLHYDFILKGSKVIQAGWHQIKGHFFDHDEVFAEALPEFKNDDRFKIRAGCVVEKETNPPALYTEAELLLTMENAGKRAENEEQCKALQNIGIGTPAMRASIIEALLGRGYIIREGKSLVPTEKGLRVYQAVKDKKIADVAMAAEWEIALKRIENCELDAVDFHQSMEAYTTSVVQELLSMNIEYSHDPDLICPKCKAYKLIIRDKVARCSDEACGWILFRKMCGVQLDITEIENLVTRGKTNLIKGMKSKAGKTFDAYIILKDKGESSLEFSRSSTAY
ncbi:DNA topoisomerase III [Elizabethkingia anophelis]|nr:topoisomerase C-terminal repeat-containing protein [Elizabethkingia anophelis]MDV3578306.1 DNA topoisomerase III [Elizabethkingia anophelis]